MSKSKKSEKGPVDSTIDHEIESNEVENTAAEEIASEEKLEPTVEEQLTQEKDKFLRLFAEFENYKKRTSKERIELFKTAGQEVISSLLPVIDDFTRALKESDKLDNSADFEGFRLISNKLNETLKAKGLTPVEVEVGEVFDAEKHEAITQIPAGEDQSGKIIDITEQGYQLGEKIIRYPKVVVGQ